MSRSTFLLLLCFFFGLVTAPVNGETPKVPGFRLTENGNTITLVPTEGQSPKDVVIPRLFNGVRKLVVVEGEQKIAGTVQPEIVTWKLSWPNSTIDWSKAKIELELDSPVQLEPKPIHSEADGSFRLKASLALTQGSKLRYEPQPFKNTVGYWADAKDFAWWTLDLDRPGKFNMAALQGCGAGQGGSDVEFRILREPTSAESPAIASLSMIVEETGHFQNFHWRHLGELSLPEAGQYRIEIRCKQKPKGAVGDFREVQLVRLPN